MPYFTGNLTAPWPWKANNSLEIAHKHFLTCIVKQAHKKTLIPQHAPNPLQNSNFSFFSGERQRKFVERFANSVHVIAVSAFALRKVQPSQISKEIPRGLMPTRSMLVSPWPCPNLFSSATSFRVTILPVYTNDHSRFLIRFLLFYFFFKFALYKRRLVCLLGWFYLEVVILLLFFPFLFPKWEDSITISLLLWLDKVVRERRV